MEQKIYCKEGKCIDMDYLTCKDKFDDYLQVLECELLEASYKN